MLIVCLFSPSISIFINGLTAPVALPISLSVLEAPLCLGNVCRTSRDHISQITFQLTASRDLCALVFTCSSSLCPISYLLSNTSHSVLVCPSCPSQTRDFMLCSRLLVWHGLREEVWRRKPISLVFWCGFRFPIALRISVLLKQWRASKILHIWREVLETA